MSHRVEHCFTPTTAFRRIGSVWCCPTCGQVYVLTLQYSMWESFKAWMKADLKLEVQL